MTSTVLPIHPTSGLQAIGFTRKGPVWPIMGGSGDGDTTEDPKEDSTDDADASKDDTGGDDTGDDAAGKSDADKAADDKPITDWKARSRQNENAKKAAEKKLNSVLAALGVGDGGDLTPAQLKEKFEAANAETAGLKVENAVIKAATKAGVDADELTDSKRFMSKVADLDPTDSAFADDMKKLIDAEVKGRPSLKVGGVVKAGTSGKETTGNNGKGQLTRADLAKLTPTEIVKAQEAGRLDSLMGKK